MASAAPRNIYQANNSSSYLPSYQQNHQRESSSLEDYKSPAEYDIIDAYSASAVSLPKQSYPANVPYSPTAAGRQAPLYPPFHQKPSFQSSYDLHSDLDGGTEAGLDNQKFGTSEVIAVPEKRSFLQTVLPESVACRFYVLVVLIETIVDIAIEVELRARVDDFGDHVEGDLSTKRLPVYLSMFAAAHLFQLVMAIDAVAARNTLQFLFLTIFNALFLLYAVIQIFEIRQSLPPNDNDGGVSNIPVNVLTTIIPIVISLAELAYIALGWKIWREFGWKVYKQLGADRRIKRMYAQYQIFLGIMKFDLFFFAGFCVQLILLILVEKDWEWYLTCAALPFSVVVLVDGWLAARYENKWMMYSFIIGCGSALVYFVYKLHRLYDSSEDVKEVSKTLTVFAVIAIILLLITVVVAFIVLRNFGNGLKTKMAKPVTSDPLKRKGTTMQHIRNQSYPMSSNPNRMSID